MGKKFFSLIIVPHTKAGYKTISFTKKALKTFIWSSIALAVILLALMADYIYIKSTKKSYRALSLENKQQKETLTEYENSIAKLRKKVEKFEEYTKKLNTMAGLNSPEVLKELGIGGESYADSEEQSLLNTPPQLSLVNVKSINEKAENIESELNTLVIFFENQTARLASTPSIWPTYGWQSSSFGPRDDPFTGKESFHRGIDIATNYGNPIVVTADGIVAQVRVDFTGGKTVLISHGQGVSTFYCHLSKFLVKEGQKVKRGDVIGLVGKTGKALGPHLHYEVRINDKPVNPLKFILEE